MEQKRKFDRRNKGGRPKKEAADKLKYRLTVKMATSDYYTLKGKARGAGISAGEFLRECMKSCHVKERLMPEHTDYVRKLCGMANNLNQLTKLSHQTGFYRTRLLIEGLLGKLKRIMDDYRPKGG